MLQPARIIRRERGNTRDRILDAARELFARHGYAGTSVRAIARHAGVTDPALYYYFPTKRELHQSLLFAPDVDDIALPDDSLESAIEACVAVFMRHAEDGDLARLSLRELLSGDPDTKRLHREAGESFRSVIRPFLQARYGDDACAVEDIVQLTLTGKYWDAIVRYGRRFEEVVKEEHFQTRLRELLLACLPDAAEQR